MMVWNPPRFSKAPIAWWEWPFLWLLPTRTVTDNELTLSYKMWMGKMYIMATEYSTAADGSSAP